MATKKRAAKKAASPKTASKREVEVPLEKLSSFLRDPDIQKHFEVVLKQRFPRFNPAQESLSPEQVTLRLLHRDAAEQFLEALYEVSSVPRPRKTLTPKFLKR